MNRQPQPRRSDKERNEAMAENYARADANLDCWIRCEPSNYHHSHYELRSDHYDVCEIKGQMHIRRLSGQLFPTVAPVDVLVTPVEVAPVPVMAVAGLDAYDVLKAELIAAGLNENCLTCRFNRNWECRRHAAVAAENGFANWATVEPDDWCGEYQDIEVHGP
jgi:hypothetical protein